jgi:hypothetical protein
MKFLENRLERAGYRTLNTAYPSREYPLHRLADFLWREIDRRHVHRAPRVHFVTHSMGGILLRIMFLKKKPPNLGRVVMLGPPNRGAEVVDCLKEYRIFQVLLGPAAVRLGTRPPESLPAMLPSVDFELGVIIGDRGWKSPFVRCIPRENDGMVSVAHAKVPGMADCLVLPVDHTGVLLNPRAADAVRWFLATGRFPRQGARSGTGRCAR